MVPSVTVNAPEFDLIERFNQIFKKKPINSEDAETFLGKEQQNQNPDVLFSVAVKV